MNDVIDDQSGDDPLGLSPGQGEETEGKQTPEVVTEEDFSAFRQELKKDLSKMYQGIQSMTDKSISNVNKDLSDMAQQVDDVVKTVKRYVGGDITPQQEQDLRDRVTLDLIREQPSQQGKQPPGQGETSPTGGEDQPQDDGLTDEQRYWTKAAQELMDKEGVKIEEDDPEANIIDKASEGTPIEYLDAHRKAIEAKRKRLGEEAKGRTPTGNAPPAGHPLEGMTDLDQIWERVKLD